MNDRTLRRILDSTVASYLATEMARLNVPVVADLLDPRRWHIYGFILTVTFGIVVFFFPEKNPNAPDGRP